MEIAQRLPQIDSEALLNSREIRRPGFSSKSCQFAQYGECDWACLVAAYTTVLPSSSIRRLIKLSRLGVFIGRVPVPGPKYTCTACQLLKLWHHEAPHKAPPLFWNEGTSISWAPLPSGWFVSAIILWNRSGKWLQCEDRDWWRRGGGVQGVGWLVGWLHGNGSLIVYVNSRSEVRVERIKKMPHFHKENVISKFLFRVSAGS